MNDERTTPQNEAADELERAAREYRRLVAGAENWEKLLSAAVAHMAIRKVVLLRFREAHLRARIELLAPLAEREIDDLDLPDPPELPDREEVRGRAIMRVRRACERSGQPHRTAEAADALEGILWALGPRDRERVNLDRKGFIERQLRRLPEDEAEALREVVLPPLEELLERERAAGRTGVPSK